MHEHSIILSAGWLLNYNGFCNISSMRRSISSPDETLRRRELKIRRAEEYFDELRGVSSGDETQCRMLDITFSNEMILEGEIKDVEMSSFSSHFQTLIKH